VPEHVILLPGGVTPAAVEYAELARRISDDFRPFLKDLEVYAADKPPADYSLQTEIDGVLRAIDALQAGRVHLVGFSAGGASSLAFASLHPARLLSLGLIEPAWMGNEGLDPAERAVRVELARIMTLPHAERLSAFARVQLAPAIEPPPRTAEPAPAWMASRPAGLRALSAAFGSWDLDLDALSDFEAPVYFAYGRLSNADFYARTAIRAKRTFRDLTVDVFDDRHHLDPPHRAEPGRTARSLERLWRGASDH